jgi:hypothetical protein
MMKSRCGSKSATGFKFYGGRGITVCKRWLHSFENFLADMGKRPKGKSLDRKNNNSDYCPSNCKWSTQSEQMNNSRWNTFFTHNGKTQSMMLWSKELGVSYRNIIQRRRRGWSLKEAILTP